MMVLPAFVYQPIVALATARPLFFEMLARFPNDGISTQERIMLAERTGSIVELDVYALTSAIDVLRRHETLSLSVNVSPVSVERAFARLVDILRSVTGLNRRLIVEVTETQPFGKWTSFNAFAEVMRSLGIRIAVDDYGDGFAELARTMQSRPSFIKLSFPDFALDADAVIHPTLLEVTAVAREIGARVIVEHIEDLYTVQLLQRAGVELGQGYYFARPSNLEGIADSLREVWQVPLAARR